MGLSVGAISEEAAFLFFLNDFAEFTELHESWIFWLPQMLHVWKQLYCQMK